MYLDLSTLAALRPPRKPRRPVAEEMLSIRVRDVRPLVEVGQETPRLRHPLGEMGGPSSAGPGLREPQHGRLV